MAAIDAAAASAAVAAPGVAGVTISENELDDFVVEQEVTVKVVTEDGSAYSLTLELTHTEDALEPIFSGASWAGTVVWPAAIALIEQGLLKTRAGVGGDPAAPLAGLHVIELGCGLGVPGMVASRLGAASSVLTEQPQLLPLLVRNVEKNWGAAVGEEGGEAPPASSVPTSSAPASSAPASSSAEATPPGAAGAARPDVMELSWGTDESAEYLEARGGKLPDVVLCCDCVFEPLYGDSWKVLVDTLNVLAPLERAEAGEATTVLISMERRNEDGVLQFLEKLRLTFDVTVEWSSFEEAELAALLKASHIGEEHKPLQLLRAVRVR